MLPSLGTGVFGDTLGSESMLFSETLPFCPGSGRGRPRNATPGAQPGLDRYRPGAWGGSRRAPQSGGSPGPRSPGDEEGDLGLRGEGPASLGPAVTKRRPHSPPDRRLHHSVGEAPCSRSSLPTAALGDALTFTRKVNWNLGTCGSWKSPDHGRCAACWPGALLRPLGWPGPPPAVHHPGLQSQAPWAVLGRTLRQIPLLQGLQGTVSRRQPGL